MARAIVQGRKTVTRRPCRDQYPGNDSRYVKGLLRLHVPCAPGDLMIGRECWAHLSQHPESEFNTAIPMGGNLEYRADHDPPRRKPGGWSDAEPGDPEIVNWRPSIHMPDWAARIRRKVVAVSVERLQDITEDDAVREGFDPHDLDTGPRESDDAPATGEFIEAWDSIYAPRGFGWGVSPWVWRIEFERESEP